VVAVKAIKKNTAVFLHFASGEVLTRGREECTGTSKLSVVETNIVQSAGSSCGCGPEELDDRHSPRTHSRTKIENLYSANRKFVRGRLFEVRWEAEVGPEMPEAEVITNNHHDEEVSISDAESVPDQGGGDSDPSDADDDAGARGTGPGPPALRSHPTPPPGEMLCARVRACAA